MRIGIDIDGVLTNINQYLCDYGSKYFYEKYGRININLDEFLLSKMFNVSKEDATNCYMSVLESYATKEPARKYASDIIKKLKNDGNEIYIISSRCSDGTGNLSNKMPNIIKDWLKRNNIPYDMLFLYADDKLKVCLENNIDIMIDDCEANIKKVSSIIPVICYHANHNINCIGDNIYRAYSWYHIYSIIKNQLTQKNKIHSK